MKELTIEEKAKFYDEAIKVAKSKIKNDKDHVLYEEDITDIFPELKKSKESEYDEIRKELLEIFKENKGPIYISLTPQKKSFLISLLEKKTWSEEDEKLLYLTVDNLEEIMSRYGELYGLVGKCITWLKSLKGRVQHKNHWKPSEEQMEVLVWCMPLFIDPKSKAVLESLIKDLKKL